MVSLSLILPVYNEEEVINENVKKLCEYMESLKCINKFEILVCPNGCTDNTERYSKQLANKYSKVKVFPKNEKGIGTGLREGLIHARYKYSMFYAVDLPFSFSIIESSIKEKDSADIIIGSKSHKKSVISRDYKRKLFSAVYSNILRFVFKLNVKDTQGSLFFPTKKIKSYINKLSSNNSFFETQLVIYGYKRGLKAKEIPVELRKSERSSKINLIYESFAVLRDLIKEFYKKA